ncbi:hypothetical protein KDX27_30345 [Burkholderia cenocepacia]|uniref:hypothetical protein n=1 Tax=Burkholderia cenocepacia TaxID=95486 RepID=UPI0013E0DC0C|nr:hypothetical protein [Burkholderia cenocepacia]MBR7905956.1 hypothetical protein [Burkholderia cenocepacia]MBR8028906.1 hypothetical protein [Burkholderia cenocepacia]MBR8172034.1 hypothetical protein [Burkholderia cenocepacia]MBR8426948.1 hypothetical protein [Burkholderia cenocepacia]MBU9656082.1 hypothetical protein [Burkholderia cenocepacia]
MLTIGIDPGISGALAVLDHNGALRVEDMPTRTRAGSGKTRNEVDPRRVLHMLRDIVPAGESPIVVMEDMHAFMGGGNERKGSMASQASLAATKAVICAVIEIAGHATQLITPQRWQSFYGIKKREDETTKQQSLRIARELYGQSFCPLVKHHGRADAILIARWAQRNLT